MGYSRRCGCAAIVTGGKASRLGADKAALRVGGRPIVLRQLDVLLPLFDEVLIIGRRPAVARAAPRRPEGVTLAPALRFMADEIPGKGPLGGLYTALGATGSEAVFLIACDMPFIEAGLIRRVLDAFEPPAEAAVFRCGEFLEPLHAVYSCAARPVVRGLLDADRLRMKFLLDRLRTVYLPLPALPRALFNINRPEDLAQAQGSRRQAASPLRRRPS